MSNLAKIYQNIKYIWVHTQYNLTTSNLIIICHLTKHIHKHICMNAHDDVKHITLSIRRQHLQTHHPPKGLLVQQCTLEGTAQNNPICWKSTTEQASPVTKQGAKALRDGMQEGHFFLYCTGLDSRDFYIFFTWRVIQRHSDSTSVLIKILP